MASSASAPASRASRARATTGRGADKRRRTVLTPEGLTIPLTIASRGARAGALLLDLALIGCTLLVLVIVFAGLGIGVLGLGQDGGGPMLEVLAVLAILALFFARFGYFLVFELGPRGATPGKRALGIRIAARAEGAVGGRLTAEAVIARNLMRDVEVFIPAAFLMSGAAGSGAMGLAAFVWLAVFVLFPFFNRDNLRAGDLVAGTWVVESPRRRLPEAMSLGEAGAGGAQPAAAYRFGEAELAVYGEHELQVLENVLRDGRPEALREVMETICRKIGWEAGRGDERAFLEAFYEALRAHLERGMRFGRRKRDKFDG